MEHYIPPQELSNKYLIEISIILIGAIVVLIISALYNLSDSIVAFADKFAYIHFNELITVSPMWLFLVLAAIFFSYRRYREIIEINYELQQTNTTLRKAMTEIKQLQGILPICSSCKKIRDDAGYWHKVENYITHHSNVEFSHGICPKCADRDITGIFKD